jgi:hypothetical protein
MTKETEITLRNGQVEFRVLVYRENEGACTIEGMIDADSGRILEVAVTDAVSAKTRKVKF